MTTEKYDIVPCNGVANNYFQSESGESLLEDCKSIIVEHEFASRWALVEGYHTLGERIVNDTGYKEYAKGNNASLQSLAENLKISDRTLYYSIQFYEKYPDLTLFNTGKNISWHQVISKYLPNTKEPTKKHLNRAELIQMLKEIKTLLQHLQEEEHQLGINDDSIIPDYMLNMRDFIRYLQDQFNKITSEVEL